jgi:hypothetical protein
MKDVEAAKIHHQLLNRITLDIHFYLICWDKVDKYRGRLSTSMKENQCVQTICSELGQLTAKASRARNHFEHLDRYVDNPEAIEGGYGFGGYRHFALSYVDISKHGEKQKREVTLGYDELVGMMTGYERILSCLGANITLGYVQSLRRRGAS